MQNVDEPGKILDHLNANFEEIFGHDDLAMRDRMDLVMRDGMDLAFCVLDKANMVINYAGAQNPLYIIRDGKLIEIKGDRFSVGADMDITYNNFEEKKFTTHKLKIQKKDMIYLFSDGYADQFGGLEGKKYKYRRFRHLLLNIHELPVENQRQYLEDSIEEWRGNIEQLDDILVIGIRADFN